MLFLSTTLLILIQFMAFSACAKSHTHASTKNSTHTSTKTATHKSKPTHTPSTINSTHDTIIEGCKLRAGWRKNLASFDATQDCRSLNEILGTAKYLHQVDFCAAKPDIVLKYINASLSKSPGGQPKSCEVNHWYYGDYGGKQAQPFCRNATDIVSKGYGTNKTYNKYLTRTQPYLSVFHGPRSACNEKLKSDLEAMGDPDISGIGVMVSQSIGIGFLLLFFAASRWPEFMPTINILKSLQYFYATTTLLAFSVTTAAIVTFWRRRAETNQIYANFGYVNLYAYSTLALAPPLSIMPAVVLVTLPSKAWKEKGKEAEDGAGNVKLALARLTVTLLYLYCVVVLWVIWSVGIKGQRQPTHVEFGNRLNINVSGFLYERAGTYIYALGTLMIALPTIGLLAWTGMSGLRWACTTDEKGQRLERFTFICSGLCLVFGLTQFAMFVYIRSQAIGQAHGKTSEMDWGFGQILVLFTWLPLLLTIMSEIWKHCITRIRKLEWYTRLLGAC
ncbi:unnamed protein product [Periconia digitata]|uniref:Uncharacterized protein n=1 Tax=Periconia digitata TaxID=1303443 RepID=A0A9W4UUB0_9PLEO|nr:unnamed protein product [Periconia digitata]